MPYLDGGRMAGGSIGLYNGCLYIAFLLPHGFTIFSVLI